MTRMFWSSAFHFSWLVQPTRRRPRPPWSCEDRDADGHGGRSTAGCFASGGAYEDEDKSQSARAADGCGHSVDLMNGDWETNREWMNTMLRLVGLRPLQQDSDDDDGL